MSDPTLWYVQNLGLIKRLNASPGNDLASQGKRERWGHRAEITRRSSDVVVVLKGAVDLNDGRHAKLVRLKPGDVYGDRGEAADGDVLRAFDEATICRIDRDKFNALAQDSLGAFGATIGLRKRRNLTIPVAELLFRPSTSRLARLLEVLADEFGEKRDSEVWLPVSLKPKHLANLTGIVSSRARGVLEILQSDDLMRVEKNGIVLPDFEAISELAKGWET